MKTVAIVTLALLPVFAFGQTGSAPYIFDGYMWEEMGKDESLVNLRTSLLAGFINGFDYGYLAAYAKGIVASREVMLEELDKAGGKFKQSKQREAFKAVVSKADDSSWLKLKKTVTDAIRVRVGPKEKIEEYSKDVDQFLKAYPLCRKRDIFTIFNNLSRVWEQTDTYKNVGQKCSETE